MVDVDRRRLPAPHDAQQRKEDQRQQRGRRQGNGLADPPHRHQRRHRRHAGDQRLARLQVGEQPEPEPGAGEVRVALRTSGINPSDVKKRAGSMPELLSDGYIIPHSDGAGVIDAVGKNVNPARVGERVWVYQA